MWKPTLADPANGRLTVYLSDHPGMNRTEVLVEDFNPVDMSAEDVAEAVISTIWELQEHTPYGVDMNRTDVNWGADISLVSVIVDVSSILSGAFTAHEIAQRIRDGLKRRHGSTGQDDE